MRPTRLTRLAVAASAAVLVAPAAACAQAPDAPGAPATVAQAPSSAAAGSPGPETSGTVEHVVAISMDGFNPTALAKVGKKGAPVLHRLMRQGSFTLNARTETERTITLPNHTSMVTSRRIQASRGGHGVTWNDDRLTPPTVQAAAGGPVGSVFSALHAVGEETALFASKTKFSLWDRSWPEALDQYTTDPDNRALARAARDDIATHDRAFTFVHLSAPDVAGHAKGWMSPAYLKAVRATDRNVGIVLKGIKRAGAVGDTVVIVTADHGGVGPNHVDKTVLGNYRIPFLVRGPGVPPGDDLYALNPSYKDPGTKQPSYAARRPPVRNGVVGNLALDVLGYAAIPDSELDAAQDLDVFEE